MQFVARFGRSGINFLQHFGQAGILLLRTLCSKLNVRDFVKQLHAVGFLSLVIIYNEVE